MSDDIHPSRREADELASSLRATYKAAALRGDGPAAEAVLREALDAGLGAAAAFARIVQPALEDIGDAWERGEVSVAEEHLASGITKRALAAIYPLLIDGAPQNGPRVLLAGVGGELHSIGLRMISDVLDAAGFDTVYLGPDTPADEVAAAVTRHAPQLVGLSVTMPLDLPELDRAIVAVGETDPTVSVMIGGRAIPERLRAYRGYAADAESVVAVARLLVDEAPVLPPVPEGAVAAAVVPRPDPLEREMAETTGHLAEVARAQARRAREYRALALTDTLTGMPNRRAWEERYSALADTTPLVVLMVDLDNFKLVNDRQGHMAGDVVLQRAGIALRAVLRSEDFAARLGGDEFGVLLPGATDRGALVIAERVRHAIATALADVGVTASVGVARHAGGRRATTLGADQALYRAKARGGDSVEQAQ